MPDTVTDEQIATGHRLMIEALHALSQPQGVDDIDAFVKRSDPVDLASAFLVAASVLWATLAREAADDGGTVESRIGALDLAGQDPGPILTVVEGIE